MDSATARRMTPSSDNTNPIRHYTSFRAQSRNPALSKKALNSSIEESTHNFIYRTEALGLWAAENRRRRDSAEPPGMGLRRVFSGPQPQGRTPPLNETLYRTLKTTSHVMP